MSLLSYLTRAQIRDSIRTLEGKMLTRPALVKADGSDLSYAANVEISTDPADLAVRANTLLWEAQGDLQNRILYNVPIAHGARDLAYADAGQPVTLTRSDCGTFEVTGFAKKAPGSRVRIPVYLGMIADGSGVPVVPPTIGDAYDATLRIHYLTLGEMGDPRFAPAGWGSLPLGSYALYRGGVLVAINGTSVDIQSGGGDETTAPTIQSFTASPDSIVAGDSVTLAWAVFGASSVTIDQGIGAVAGSGSRSVAPTATVTYTLTATGGGSTVVATVTVAVGTEEPIDLAYDFGSTP